MIGLSGLRAASLALAVTCMFQVLPARAQVVDTPQNLLKAWAEAFATRSGEPMTRVYAPDAQLWGSRAKEAVVGIENIKQYYDRTGQNVTERTATITKMQVSPRKRLTFVAGTMDIKVKLNDGTLSNSKTRFSMSIVREARRQWSIVSHHASLSPD